VHSFSEAKFLASWQMDLNVKDLPLVEVLKEITAPVAGWEPEIVLAKNSAEGERTLNPDVLKTPITLSLQKVSRLEAIELACEAAGRSLRIV
jgi:hypothetical protein